jgi:cystathionine beta-lyase family protein involved in aluminum resistance
MIIYLYTGEKFGSEETMAKISLFPTEVHLSAPVGLIGVLQKTDTLLSAIGAAYDTEKAFDTMFLGDPSITDWGANWT